MRHGYFLLACIVIFGVLATPTVASAATVRMDGKELVYEASPGEANDPNVWLDPVDATVEEPHLTAGPGCKYGGNGQWVDCTGPIDRFRAELGDGQDSVEWEHPDHGGEVPVTVDGGEDGDRLSAGPGPARLLGGPGDDIIEGGAGDDYLDSGPGVGQVNGEAGDDTLIGGDGWNIMHGGRGDDHLVGNDGTDELFGGDARQPDDPDPGNDVLEGGPGYDYIDGEGGSDDMSGGPGPDTVRYLSATQPMHLDFDGDADDGAAGENDRIAADVENIQGGSGDDVIVGNDRSNGMNGEGGNDLLLGRLGADGLGGGEGDDRVYGSWPEGLPGGPTETELRTDGDDWVSGGPGNDTLQGGAGFDTLWGEEGDDSIDAHEPPQTVRQINEDVNCGEGLDEVKADDSHDDNLYDCETVTVVPFVGPGVPWPGEPDFVKAHHNDPPYGSGTLSVPLESAEPAPKLAVGRVRLSPRSGGLRASFRVACGHCRAGASLRLTSPTGRTLSRSRLRSQRISGARALRMAIHYRSRHARRGRLALRVAIRYPSGARKVKRTTTRVRIPPNR